MLTSSCIDVMLNGNCNDTNKLTFCNWWLISSLWPILHPSQKRIHTWIFLINTERYTALYWKLILIQWQSLPMEIYFGLTLLFIIFFNLQAIRKKAPTNENFHLTVSKCTLISMKRFRKACEKYRHFKYYWSFEQDNQQYSEEYFCYLVSCALNVPYRIYTATSVIVQIFRRLRYQVPNNV